MQWKFELNYARVEYYTHKYTRGSDGISVRTEPLKLKGTTWFDLHEMLQAFAAVVSPNDPIDDSRWEVLMDGVLINGGWHYEAGFFTYKDVTLDYAEPTDADYDDWKHGRINLLDAQYEFDVRITCCPEDSDIRDICASVGIPRNNVNL